MRREGRILSTSAELGRSPQPKEPTTMDYMEQLSWLLFLKSFEETDKKPQEIEAMTGAVLERAFRGEL